MEERLLERDRYATAVSKARPGYVSGEVRGTWKLWVLSTVKTFYLMVLNSSARPVGLNYIARLQRAFSIIKDLLKGHGYKIQLTQWLKIQR